MRNNSLPGYKYGKTEQFCARIALLLSRRPDLQICLASPNAKVAHLTLSRIAAHYAAAQGDEVMKRPGAKFEHWYIVHNIPDLVMRYSR